MPVSNIDVPDFGGTSRNVNTLPALGTAADSASLPVALSTEGKAQLGATSEAAAANPSATSGLSGVLKGLWTSLLTLIGAKAPGTAATSSLLAGGLYTSGGVTLTTGQQAALQMTSTGALMVSGSTAGTQYAEDAAHVSGDSGTMALGVRKDTAAATAGTDGDYMPMIFDANGRLHASIAGNLYTEDAAAASDPVGPVLLAVRRDTLSTSEVSADGDNIALKASNKGQLHVAAEITNVNGNGQATMANSAPVAIASNQSAIPITDNSGSITVDNAGTFAVQSTLQAGTAMIGHVGGTEYETVAASQTAQALGATGATGDYIAGVLVVPATTSPGNVLLLDNATSITVFAGGASSVSNLVPFFIPLGIKSVSGAWKLTTGTNVSCIGVGDFT